MTGTDDQLSILEVHRTSPTVVGIGIRAVVENMEVESAGRCLKSSLREKFRELAAAVADAIENSQGSSARRIRRSPYVTTISEHVNAVRVAVDGHAYREIHTVMMPLGGTVTARFGPPRSVGPVSVVNDTSLGY